MVRQDENAIVATFNAHICAASLLCSRWCSDQPLDDINIDLYLGRRRIEARVFDFDRSFLDWSEIHLDPDTNHRIHQWMTAMIAEVPQTRDTVDRLCCAS